MSNITSTQIINTVNKINNNKNFTLKNYFEYIGKYGKDHMLKVFKEIVTNDQNISNLYEKYFDIILTIELDELEVNSNNLCKIINKYGSNKINEFFIKISNYDCKTTEFTNFSNKISSFIDIMVEMDSDIVEEQTDEEVSSYISEDSIKAYLKEICETPLLTPEEEKELAIKVAQGDDVAMKKLINANLRLVVSIAKKHIYKGIDFLDVIQEGNIGLMKAATKFDVNKGNKFSTYATWWIRQSITRAVADQAKLIRIPVHMDERIKKINRTKSKLTVTLNREPSIIEIANVLNIDEELVKDAILSDIDLLSLDIPKGESDDVFLKDIIAGPTDIFEEYSKMELREKINECLNTLTEKEAYILRLRFGLIDGDIWTLERISDIYGITRERVRQIENKTLKKLKGKSRRQIIEDFL